MEQVSHLSHRMPHKGDEWAVHGLFAVLFMAFFAVALLAQVLLLDWRSWFPGAESSKTMTGGVRAAVYTLMSHLT